ncbi:MAG: hypothetical protein M9963_06410 [Kiritimatiellae bacterium]|nr:hypothetical protein [Kiritimatiellia bacterium]MCO5061621.1 hypothetical protein [Kiritimatiellia bacterium]
MKKSAASLLTGLLAALVASGTGAEPVVTRVDRDGADAFRIDFTGPTNHWYYVQVADRLDEPHWRNPCVIWSTGVTAVSFWEGATRSSVFRILQDPIPTAHVARYRNLHSNLFAFADRVAALPPKTNEPHTALGLPSLLSNGNRGWTLLTATNRTRMLSECDRYHEMGAGVLKLDITYPLLTPSFHQQLANQPGYGWYAGITVTNYLLVYAELIQRARSNGMAIAIEHSSLIPSYSVIDPFFYYDEIRALGADAGRQRYRAERSAECELIMQWLAPDFFSVVLEPDAQNTHFGGFDLQPLMYPEQWQSYVQQVVDDLAVLFPMQDTRMGAGLGTWEDETYKDLFIAVTNLHYVDLHIYPLANSDTHYLTNMIQWCDDVMAAGKRVSIGEAWLYKASAEDMQNGNAFHDEVYARDLYGFWEPLDIAFIQVVDQFARKQDMLFLAFFWPNYLFGYVDYTTGFQLDPGQTPDDLPPSVRLGMADDILMDALSVPQPFYTETGRVMQRLFSQGE